MLSIKSVPGDQEALKGQISGILDQMHGKNYATIEQYLKDCYEDGYLGTMYDLAQQGIPVITPINQAQMTQAILTDSKIKEGYYEYLGVDVDKLKKTITQEVSRGIASSLSYADIARNINNASRSGLSNAQRIARTEGHRIQNVAALDSAKNAKAHGADIVKIWDATLDGKTRESHRKVDGEIRELDDKFSIGMMYPGDPEGGAAEVCNCRCAEIHKPRWALEEGFTKMDNFTGELVEFKSPKDYADFKEKYWKPENQKYMQYYQELEAKYGTQKFESILKQMTDKEYDKLKSLQDASPLYKSKVELPFDVSASYPEYSRIINKGDAILEAGKSNPNYDSKSYLYTHNCQRCVPAWELRQRGFDVIAKPCLPKGKTDVYASSPYSVWDFNIFDKDPSKRVQTDKQGTGKEKIIEFLLNCGNNSRVEIVVEWEYYNDEHVGHAFAAQNIDGKIVFIDPQNGKSGEYVENYFNIVKHGKTSWLRIDTLTLSEKARSGVIENPYG